MDNYENEFRNATVGHNFDAWYPLTFGENLHQESEKLFNLFISASGMDRKNVVLTGVRCIGECDEDEPEEDVP